MGDLYVPEIVHYKSDVRLEHEYLVAIVKGKQGGRHCLQLERSLSPQQEPHHSDIEGLDDGKAGPEGEQLQSRSSGGSLQDLRCVEPVVPSTTVALIIVQPFI
jgi:hypothetical protein